jgi:tetratricopeptide (TPR) repeat protein
MRVAVSALTLCAALAAGASPLLAQPLAPPTPPDAPPLAPSESDKPTAEQVTAAREHYAKGKAAQDAGEFETASEEYLAAYAASPQPLLLYNVAQVKRLSGANDEAIEYYEKYLTLDPDGPGAANSREIVAELRAAKEQDKPPIEPLLPEEEEARSLPIEPPGPPDIVIPILEPKRKAPSGKTLKIMGISTAGLGVVAIGAGVIFGLKARSKSDEVSSYEGRWDETKNQLFDDGESAERLMLISTTVGAAAVITGGVLYYMGARKDARAERLEVGVNDSGVTVSITGYY